MTLTQVGRVRVAVIDSGIAAGHPHVGMVHGGVALVGDEPGDWMDRLGHGTAVAAAIRDHARDAELLAVRVFADTLATSARILAAAITWAADQGAQLVNLSVGTTNEAHRTVFAPVIRDAADRGVLVVAAAVDRATQLLPGTMASVIGVEADDALPREALRVRPPLGEGVTRVVCSPRPRPIEGVAPERNLSGVSFAVANATGLLACALRDRGPDGLRAWLAAGAPP